MRYFDIIFTAVAVMLLFIAFRLILLERLSAKSIEASAAVVASNQALINSNQRLETSFNNLRQEISDLKAQLPKK